MAARERSIYLGPKLRRIRRDLGLTQAAMARDLSVSASYIALLERNQRPVTADLMLRLVNTYSVDLTTLSADNADVAAARIGDHLRDPMFADIELDRREALDVVGSYPGVAEAFSRLYAAYRETQMTLADATGSASVGADPIAEARRFLAARKNAFPEIDDAAERIAKEANGPPGLISRLKSAHKIETRFLPPDVMAGSVRRFNRHSGELLLDATLDGASRAFHLAVQTAYFELRPLIEQALAPGDFATESGERLARRALGNYAGAAILMPYGQFFSAAEQLCYDLESLARTFGVSFEQAAHRLTTLQKPGQEGVPFFFIRVDAAGNVSKRLDGAGFPFAQHGGSCPLWSVHDAFRTPRRVVCQWVELPGGERFFSIARTVTAGGGRHGAPRIERAIALGCAADFADRLVYTQGRDLAHERPDPIGVTCRLCQRTNCIARAEPPIGRQVLADDYRRANVSFGLADT
ncbi:MAG: short-chain fatty acyl-CoA regulator family protein [Pseudomonadota bacterium]